MAYDVRKWSAKTPVRRHRATAPLALLLLAVQCVSAVSFVFRAVDPDDSGTLLPGIMAVVLATSMSPFARDTWVGRGSRVFDEFEADAVAQATRVAFAILLALMIALCGWMWLGLANGWEVPTTPGQWRGLGATLLFGGTILPVALAEWMVPLPTAADDAEDDA